MPITPFLRGEEFFAPELGVAFVNVCEQVGLADKADPLTRLVARTNIELARRGIKDPDTMAKAALKEIERPKPPAQLGKTG
jgi:hypothetical protein